MVNVICGAGLVLVSSLKLTLSSFSLFIATGKGAL